MNVHVILAGLKKDTAEAFLQRMEALVSQLPAWRKSGAGRPAGCWHLVNLLVSKGRI